MEREPYDVIDLKALKCFWAMARHRSFTRAGVALGISEAAVSQRVRSLEAYLGIKLYEARGGRVRLTPAGERTLQRATTLFEELEEFEQLVVRADESVEITVCTNDHVLRYMLADAVEAFSRVHPLARLHLLARSREDCVSLVRANEADAAITSPGALPDELEYEPIAACRGRILLPKGHPLGRLSPSEFWTRLDADTARRYPLIISEGQGHSGPLCDALERVGIPLVVGLEVTTHDTLMYYVQRGLGIAAVSGLCVTDSDRDRFDVVEVPPEVGGESVYGILLRVGKHQSRPLRSLLDLVREEARRFSPPAAASQP